MSTSWFVIKRARLRLGDCPFLVSTLAFILSAFFIRSLNVCGLTLNFSSMSHLYIEGLSSTNFKIFNLFPYDLLFLFAILINTVQQATTACKITQNPSSRPSSMTLSIVWIHIAQEEPQQCWLCAKHTRYTKRN